MFAATLTFARPKAVEGLRISIVFPYAIRPCRQAGKHFCTCTIMYCTYGYATKYTLYLYKYNIYTYIYIILFRGGGGFDPS